MCLVVLLCGLSCRSMLLRPERFSRLDCQDSLDSLSQATLSLFLDSLDKILTELVEPASEDLVSTIVVPQLREASKAKTYHSLAVDIDIFDRAARGAAERSIEFLYRCARQCLAHRPRDHAHVIDKSFGSGSCTARGECSDEDALLCLDSW